MSKRPMKTNTGTPEKNKRQCSNAVTGGEWRVSHISFLILITIKALASGIATASTAVLPGQSLVQLLWALLQWSLVSQPQYCSNPLGQIPSVLYDSPFAVPS